MTQRSLTLPAALFVAALTLSACGSNDLATGTTTAPSGSHGGGHGGTTSSAPAAPASPSASASDADISFLTGMKPHHQQAVQMSDLVLAADPPAEVAEVARQVKAAQAPEIEQMDRMLADLGRPADAGEAADAGGHAGGHGGMMSDADLRALGEARGDEAARRYLQGMIAHHEGAIEAAEVELRTGTYGPARQLARSIAQAQAAEITEMERLLSSL